ncbi:MAG: hypothetical protein GY934_09715 [Gammaproteobacteria bacterium]|nr:hypothetical protein [Gammaproteobacteria bacterium]
MTPLTLNFTDETQILIFANDPDSILASIRPGSIIAQATPSPEAEIASDDPLEECTVTFADGTQLSCAMLQSDLAEADTLPSIVFAERTYNTQIKRLATLETVLDTRLNSAYAVINNMPDKARRIRMHAEYLKRKAAYVSAMEAFVNGAFRD